jgi:hypothetical protein
MRWGRTQVHCNIDAKGKAVRLMMGVLLASTGALIVVLSLFELLYGQAWIYIALALMAIGAFCIVEGWAGWCALRAMGIRTRV